MQLEKVLLDYGAIKLNLKEPFIWASGIESPIYCDNRILISHPKARTQIVKDLCFHIQNNVPSLDFIVATATAGIAWGALVADQMNLPLYYVRSKPKDHGLKNLLEGDMNVLKNGQSFIVVEDLISSGKSSIHSAQAMGDQYSCKGIFSLFSYALPQAKKNFESMGLVSFPLTNYHRLIDYCEAQKLFGAEELEALRSWHTGLGHASS